MIFDEKGEITIEEILLENMTYSVINPKTNKPEEQNFKDFDDLCNIVRNPYELIYIFLGNKFKPLNNVKVTNYCYWPDKMIKTNKGICIDISIFFYLFCTAHNLESRISLIDYYSTYDYNKVMVGHAIPLFKSNRNNKIYVPNYCGNGIGGLYGPFDDYDEALNELGKFFLILHNPIKKKDDDTPFDPFPFEDPKAFSKLGFVYSYLSLRDFKNILEWYINNRPTKYYELAQDAKHDIEYKLDALRAKNTNNSVIKNNMDDPSYNFIKEFNQENKVIIFSDKDSNFIRITKDKNKINEFKNKINKYKTKNIKNIF